MQKRKLTTGKAKAKPTAKPVAAKPNAKPATIRVAKPSSRVAQTVTTIARGHANFAELSSRDGVYFTAYKRLINANGGKLTVAAIVAAFPDGKLPGYTGSAKAHDAGVIQRLVKANLIAGTGADDKPITLTATGKSRA